MNSRRRRAALSLLGLALLLGACATPEDSKFDIFPEDSAAAHSAPLGGAGLLQRKREMVRAHRDLSHFLATLESLRHRRDRNGTLIFSGFVDAYMGRHLDPLLIGEWQSRHPELLGYDVNLRVAKAEVFVALRDPRRVQTVLDDVTRRYKGRENMLVEYPVGGQSTLGEALDKLQRRKWRE